MRLGVDLTPGGLALRQTPGGSGGPEPGFVLDLRTDQHVWDGTPLEGLTALPGWSYSRAGTAWGRHADGTYTSFPAHTPRRTDMGLWCEPASTNLFPRFAPSQGQLGGNGNVADTAPPGAPPLSGLNWLALNNAGAAAYAYQSVILAAATAYTVQVWVETPDGSPPAVGATSSTGDFCLLVGGAILSGPAGMEPLAGKVWRVWSTVTTGVGPSANSGLVRYAGQTTRALKFTGFQLEAGVLATSPIVTTGAAASRAADVARLTDLEALGEVTLAAKFTLHGRVAATGTDLRIAACLDSGTSDNRLDLGAMDGAVGGRAVSGGVEQARCTVPGPVVSGAGQGVALRAKTNGFRLARNGSLSAADSSGIAPGGLTRLTLGGGGDGTGQMGGCLTRLVLRPDARPDATLVALSA
ncbi:hypothetical protein [Brevundimonas sp. A19_0]|uniref:phage head spike fiber domain-containing protein n=1 Tax=Brevundimonas sp. A19_0 TaxID=2821087 RepID=UPI001AD9C727|nr:hypothetical protein [Brevundimonas sp. A19_0]MBO9501085.1 hypothetical protein [Brevundimonas sp. A19_0]